METMVTCIMIIAVFIMILLVLVTLKLIRDGGLLCIKLPQKTNSSQLQRVYIPAEHDDPEEGKDLHLSE